MPESPQKGPEKAKRDLLPATTITPRAPAPPEGKGRRLWGCWEPLETPFPAPPYRSNQTGEDVGKKGDSTPRLPQKSDGSSGHWMTGSEGNVGPGAQWGEGCGRPAVR